MRRSTVTAGTFRLKYKKSTAKRRGRDNAMFRLAVCHMRPPRILWLQKAGRFGYETLGDRVYILCDILSMAMR